MPLSFTLRSLARTRGLSIAVVLTIAAGVAALTITVGIVNAALFRQPPFPDAGRLTMLYLERNPANEPHRRERWSFARIRLLMESQKSFEAVASYSPASLTLSGLGDADPELLRGEMVSTSYFPLRRATAQRGRLFTEAETDAGSPSPVAVIGHGLWMRRFAGDPALVGRAIRLQGIPLTVVGILPPDFRGLSGQAELWLPATMAPQLTYAG